LASGPVCDFEPRACREASEIFLGAGRVLALAVAAKGFARIDFVIAQK